VTTPQVPSRTDVKHVYSQEVERIRRLELAITRGIDQADPSEHLPGAFEEPDPLVQWLSRGGAGVTSGNAGDFAADTGWPVGYGPIARWLWERESGGVGSEHFNRQVRQLRQKVGLLPTDEAIVEIDIGGLTQFHMLVGSGFHTGVSSSNASVLGGSSGVLYRNNGRGKVIRYMLPNPGADDSLPGDRWRWVATWASPPCGSCFGNPCEPGLACDESEITYDFRAEFGSVGAWIWGARDFAIDATGPVNELWVEAQSAQAHFCTDYDGTDFWGYIFTYVCGEFGVPCTAQPIPPPHHCYCGGGPPGITGYEAGTVSTCRQPSCKFNFHYQPYMLPTVCDGCPVDAKREYRPEGSDVVAQFGGFHDMGYGEPAAYCGGVLTNQYSSFPASVFVVPDSTVAALPAIDATPEDRSICGSWSYPDPATGEGTNKDAWNFNEWHYNPPGERRVEDLLYDANRGAVAPDLLWGQLRDRIYTELATGRYPEVVDFYSAQTSVFTPSVREGWREVPLCANWYGSLWFRRVGGVVEWWGTIRNKQPIVSDNIFLASWLPPEAWPYEGHERPSRGFQTGGADTAWAWVSSPNGSVLIEFWPERLGSGGNKVTGSIRVWTGGYPYYMSGGPLDPQVVIGVPVPGAGLPTWFHPRVQTYPGGPYEQITFDGLSYHGMDIPYVPDSGTSTEWVTVP
jgi:hypothetical protein